MKRSCRQFNYVMQKNNKTIDTDAPFDRCLLKGHAKGEAYFLIGSKYYE